MSKNNLRDAIRSFKYKEEESARGSQSLGITKTSPRKPSTKRSPRKTIAADYHAKSADQTVPVLKDLPPSISADTTIVFVGYNPGVESSKQQHHYAHHTNLFWKLFNASNILQAVLDARAVSINNDEFLENEVFSGSLCVAKHLHDYKLLHYGVGFTDLVLRCTKQASELSPTEKAQNVPRLFSEFSQSQAPFIVFIGKGIWQVVCNFLVPKHRLTSENFSWGLQRDPAILRRLYSFCKYEPAVYTFPNTSGLVASMKYPEKLSLWQDLVRDIQLLHSSSEATINSSEQSAFESRGEQ